MEREGSSREATHRRSPIPVTGPDPPAERQDMRFCPVLEARRAGRPGHWRRGGTYSIYASFAQSADFNARDNSASTSSSSVEHVVGLLAATVASSPSAS